MNKKVVWITGAGKGIGRALALEMAASGDIVAASARTRDDLDTLVADAERTGGTMRAYPLDITDAAAARDVVARIERELGPIALAILNAGTHAEISGTSFDLKVFRHIVDTNLYGTANCLAALLPKLVARKAGHVAIVGSLAGYRGLPTAGAYAASKAGLIALCEAMKPELDVAGVKLQLVSPGFVDTPLTRRNSFAMPFIIPPDKAVRAILRGLDSHRFEIAFPRRMSLAMRLIKVLPYPLFFRITRGMVRALQA